MNDRDKIKDFILRRKDRNDDREQEAQAILDFIDTLEPRLIDLDFELSRVMKQAAFQDKSGQPNLRKITRYFYELGRNNAI